MQKQLLGKSPKNVSISILNANKFFTLDFQSAESVLQPPNISTLYPPLLRTFNLSPRDRGEVIATGEKSNRSAQYYRKPISSNNSFRLSYNPYGRIRKVEILLKEKKKLRIMDEGQGEHEGMLERGTCAQEPRTERQYRSADMNKIIRSFTIDPEISEQQHIDKQARKVNNSFSFNYKNRKRLLSKITPSKPSKPSCQTATLRRGSRPIDFQLNFKHFSPYAGKLSHKPAPPPRIKYPAGPQPRFFQPEPQPSLT